MDDLTEFLRARLDEDEAAAKDERVWFGPFPETIKESEGQLIIQAERVLAEVEAKRATLTAWRGLLPVADALMQEQQHGVYAGDGEYTLGAFRVLTDVIRRDAAVYSDHPGYRQEWAP